MGNLFRTGGGGKKLKTQSVYVQYGAGIGDYAVATFSQLKEVVGIKSVMVDTGLSHWNNALMIYSLSVSGNRVSVYATKSGDAYALCGATITAVGY